MNIWIAVLSAITLAYGAYYVIIGILGSLRKRRVIPSARPRKKLAVLIAARNEEGVIGECVASLKAGGLLKAVPGTAEDWLKKVEFYRPAHVILRRLER